MSTTMIIIAIVISVVVTALIVNQDELFNVFLDYCLRHFSSEQIVFLMNYVKDRDYDSYLALYLYYNTHVIDCVDKYNEVARKMNEATCEEKEDEES